MSYTASLNSDGEPRAALESREDNPNFDSDRTFWGHLLFSLYAALAVLHTFGLHLLLYRYMAYAESPFGGISPIELDEISLRPHQDGEASFSAHISQNRSHEKWDEIMIWLVKAWSITCTGCIILLPFPFSFFQIPGTNANIYALTAVLSMLICSAIGLMIAGFYLQMKDKFKSESFIKEWLKASRGLNSRDAVEFWTFLCLPASLFAWAMFFCIVTLLTIAICVNPTNKMEFNPKRVKAWHISGVIFLAIMTVGQVTQVYHFGKRILKA